MEATVRDERALPPALGRLWPAASTARPLRRAPRNACVATALRPSREATDPAADVNEVLCYHAVSDRWPADLAVAPAQRHDQLSYSVARGYRGQRHCRPLPPDNPTTPLETQKTAPSRGFS